MGYKKEKKQKDKSASSISGKLKSGWHSRYPVLIFIGGFVILISIFYLLWLSPWVSSNINPRIAQFNAMISAKILYVFGQETHSAGDSITSPFYSISVAKGCDGIEAMAVFVLALLTFPMPWRNKIFGIAAGIAILFLINIVRIITLFLIGAYYPARMEVMHAEIWPAVFIISAVGLWGAWVYRSIKIPVNPINENNNISKI